jgi:hypothetical protein
MTDLKTFNDLKLPSRLLPEVDSFFIELIAIDAIQQIETNDFDELNEKLNSLDFIFEVFPKLTSDPEFQQLWLPIKDRLQKQQNYSWDELPTRQPNENKLFVVELIAKIFGIGDGSTKGALENLSSIAESYGGIRTLIPIVAIKAYQYGVSVALQINPKTDSLDIQKIRLGSSAKFFYMAKALLDVKKFVLHEMETIETLDSIQRDNRKSISSKAGKMSYSGQKIVKRKCIEQYEATKKLGLTIVKSHFVNNFIDGCTTDELKPFSPSNIRQNLLNEIRRHEKRL